MSAATTEVGTVIRRPHRVVLAGAGLGLVWGISIRLWMRFITEHPEFTWSGTGFILGASSLVGTCLGVAWVHRNRGGRIGWRLWGLSALTLGMGAGAIMLPTVLLWALAAARTAWPRWTRISLLVLGIPVQTLVIQELPGWFTWWETTAALTWYLALIGSEALAVSIVFRTRISA